MTALKVPSNADFLDESLQFLEICRRHCTCPDNFHFVWSALKASNKRRSIYFQQPLLKEMLAGRLDRAKNVLLAGSSDAGILHVLNSIVERGQPHFTAIDICAAPVEEIKRYAAQNQIDVNAFQCAMHEVPLASSYDVIFVHNTLCFVDAEAALKILLHFRNGVKPGGMIICGMRYEFMDEMEPKEATDSETTLMKEMVANTYRDHPHLVEMLEPMLYRYAVTKHARERYRYTEPLFLELVARAGFKVVQSFADNLTPPVVLNSLPGNSSIISKVYMLEP